MLTVLGRSWRVCNGMKRGELMRAASAGPTRQTGSLTTTDQMNFVSPGTANGG